MQNHMSYSSCSCFCLLDRTIPICLSCFRAVKMWCFESNSLILTGCSTWHLMAKNTLKLSYSTVATGIQRFSKTGFTRNRPRKGRSKKLSPCAVHQVQKLASKNRRMSAASIALEVAEGQLVSAQTIFRTLQQVGLHGCRPRRKPLLKLAHKKASKQFTEDNLSKSMNYWNHVLWSDETKIYRCKYRCTCTCLAQMVSSMCGDALVRSTKKIVSCLQSSMVVVASWSGAA
ncbi:uncharacterized protein LOC131542996 [Onychostoma macrolepis]|uniref:uncharacterized protein LOC131542996 n=1 Tax=Onychostoma macrolepis TaxID=369639 RepID=UPI00272C03AC|nr:uncharacterized protein LOC131542996 [Onychostoma macrolepis]